MVKIHYLSLLPNICVAFLGGHNTKCDIQISIFMTHMPNYCCDRLAPYAFETVANFASCYTNLDLRTGKFMMIL